MKKQAKKDQNGQAVVDPNPKQIVEWLKRDLQTAISCLNMIHSDPDLLQSVADFCYGRMMNKRQQDALKKEVPSDQIF